MRSSSFCSGGWPVILWLGAQVSEPPGLQDLSSSNTYVVDMPNVLMLVHQDP